MKYPAISIKVFIFHMMVHGIITIHYITFKAWFRLNVMRKLKFFLDRKSLEIIYVSFIRPIFCVCRRSLGQNIQYEINALEKIQTEAARMAIGTTKLVFLDKLYQETG